jgi:hypothetical protein
MTKDSVDSPIKPVGRRAIVYWLFIVNVFPYVPDIIYVIASAYAPEITEGIVRTIFFDNVIDEYVKLVNLFARDRIISKVNFSQLSANLEALKQIIPDDKATKKEHQEFFYQLFKILNTAFNLTPELINLSTHQEIGEIEKRYFYINRLILDCKKVAVNISPTVWQEIEERMLRVP